MQKDQNLKIEDLIKHPIDFETRLDSIYLEAKKVLASLQNDHRCNLNLLVSNLNLNRDRFTSISSMKDVYQNNTQELINILTDERDAIADYKKIESMAIIHRNFKKVRDLSEKIGSLEKDVSSYENLDIIKDLRKKHMLSFNFEEFRYELAYYLSGTERGVYLSVTRKMNSLDRVIAEFLVDFLRIGDNFIELFRDGEVVKDVEIILEFEEQRDSITKKVNGPSDGDIVKDELKRINYRYQKRTEKDLKNKFENSMKGGIKKRVGEFWNTGIENLDSVFDDFDLFVEFRNQSLGSEEDPKLNSVLDWNSILMAYNQEIKTLVDENALSSREILFMLGFVDNFYSDFHSKFGISKESFPVTILGDCEDKFIQEYIKTASGTFISWIDTIKAKEIDNFIRRDTPPILDEDNKYVSDNFITLLSLIKEQLDPIAFNKKIFDSVANEIVRFSKSFTKEIMKVMEKESITCTKNKGKPGFEEYVIMVGNSGLKITQYVTTLPQAQNSELKELAELFLNVTKDSNTVLSTFIINTCKSVLDKLFTDDWYNEDITRVLLITLEDFLADYVNTMSNFSFFLFMDDLTNELIDFYYKQLIRNRAKIYEDCGYRVEKDCERLQELFGKYNSDVSFSDLLKISPLLGKCSLDIFIVELKSLLLARPNIKRDVIKSIIKKKDELTDGEKKTYLDRVKICFSEIQNERNTAFSSMMK